MDNNKRMTPEEMLKFYCKNTYKKVGNLSQICIINAVENYAAQEGAAEQITIDELSRQINEFRQEVAEKDALLKEANRILADYLTGKSSIRLFRADARIFVHNYKTTGKEAGK